MIIARPLSSTLYQGENAQWRVELFNQDGSKVVALTDPATNVTLRIQRDIEDARPIVDDVQMTVLSDSIVAYDLMVHDSWQGYYCGQITVTIPPAKMHGAPPTNIRRSSVFTINIARALDDINP